MSAKGFDPCSHGEVVENDFFSGFLLKKNGGWWM